MAQTTYAQSQGAWTEGVVLAAEIFPKQLRALLMPTFGLFAALGHTSLVIWAYICTRWCDLQLVVCGVSLLMMPYFW